MTITERRPPLKLGEPAPDFTLPAIDREGTVSLADYRGRSPLLLAIFRGLYCPLCRRAIALLGLSRAKLQGAGVESLGIIATKPEHARLYFRFKPTRLPLAADPDMTMHQAYGLPMPALTPEFSQALEPLRFNPTGELPEPLPLLEAVHALDRLHGFEPTENYRQEAQRQFPQLAGEFLVDRDGIIRWVYIETAKDGWASLGKFPTERELLAAARAL
jgi:peroxiredoxin